MVAVKKWSSCWGTFCWVRELYFVQAWHHVEQWNHAEGWQQVDMVQLLPPPLPPLACAVVWIPDLNPLHARSHCRGQCHNMETCPRYKSPIQWKRAERLIKSLEFYFETDVEKEKDVKRHKIAQMIEAIQKCQHFHKCTTFTVFQIHSPFKKWTNHNIFKAIKIKLKCWKCMAINIVLPQTPSVYFVHLRKD